MIHYIQILFCCVFIAGCSIAGYSSETVFEAVRESKTRLQEDTLSKDNRISDEELKKVLSSYREAIFSSLRSDAPISALLTLREKKPVEQLINLYQERDTAVMDLGGTFFGIVCRYVGAEHFVKVLGDDLDNSDPRLRMFACNALAELDDDKVVPMLESCLDDDATVPGFLDGRINFSAACGLAWQGNSEGFPILFEWAERNPKYWEHNVLVHFRRFSGKDLGTDLEAWRKHFAANPPEPPKNESYRWWGEEMSAATDDGEVAD